MTLKAVYLCSCTCNTCGDEFLILHTYVLSSGEVPHDLCPLSVCSFSLPHSLHLNPVSGARLEGGQSVGGVTVSRLGDSD